MTVCKKRLAIITPGFYEQMTGGTEYQSYLLAQAAVEAGMDVRHIYIRIDPHQNLPNRLGIALHPIDPPKCRAYFRGLGNPASFCLPKAYQTLKQLAPDYVYCRSGVVQAGLGAYYAKKFGGKSIWHVANAPDVTPTPLMPLLRRPLDLLERKLIDFAIRHSTLVLTQVGYQSILLKKHYRRDSVIMTNLLPQPKETLDKTGCFTVLWIANFKGAKQPEKFIRLAEAFADNKNIRFVMIGRPAKASSYQQPLENQIKKLTNLEYIGEQPMASVNQMLAKSHVLVNTSQYEGFSNTFVQAWMRKVPVISLMVNPDGILTKEKTGFCSGTLKQLTKDVKTLFKNPALRDEMGLKAQAYAFEHHCYENNKGRFLNLIIS
jgi:glycosyltransferase involved in cell wall biosynthesis